MIKLSKVSKYFGTNEALKRVSFSIQRGEILGLLGHNGAGKTTTLKLLTTILQPSQGTINILDTEFPTESTDNTFKTRLGYLPDEPFVHEYLTGREMLHFMGSLYQIKRETLSKQVEYLLNLFEIGKDANRYIKTYSRGMRRKISLISSLIHDPAYWLLDEPTESLDPVATKILKELIVDFKRKGAAVLISTHQLSLAESLCDRLVILHQGSLVFDGTLKELRAVTGSDLASLEDMYFRLFRENNGNQLDSNSEGPFKAFPLN